MSRGVIPSPNIWNDPAGYELQNQGVDPEAVIDAAMRAIRPWRGTAMLDVGCGTGYHLPRLAADAASVIGVEPHPPLLAAARRRVAPLPQVRVLAGGSGRACAVPPASIDIAQARWAYFFGPGCEPGLAELARVVRRGGVAFVVDVDATASTFGRWFARNLPAYDPVAVQRFWAIRGWHRQALTIRWSHPDRGRLAAALGLELPADMVERVLAEVSGSELDYGVNLFWREF